MKSIFLALGFVPIFAVSIFAASIDEQITTNEKKLASDEIFIQRMEQRVIEAKKALKAGLETAQKDLHASQVYFEASRKCAEVGIALDDANLPLPGSEGVTAGQLLTAVAAIDRLKKGVDKLQSYEQFMLDYTDGKFQKEISSLESKVKRYRGWMEELRKKTLDLKAQKAAAGKRG